MQPYQSIDSKIINHLQKGNQEAYRQIFDIYYESLCRFSYTYLHDESNAEDIVQDTFIVLWKNRGKIISPLALKSFLYTITKNKCLNFLKNKRNNTLEINDSHLDLDTDFEDKVLEEEVYRKLEMALSNLPPQSKKIIDLYLQGFKNQEIADQLGVSINTVKTLKKNIYTSLRKTLASNISLVVLFKDFLQ
ncbi:RNA polymerase sigma factor [Belliella marina]|uniref:RNA polymerase sigma factor n=1 Tax=Belliella marina TaxID=1644146 RepID=A0ABW4VPT9_9BACT